MTTPAGAGGPRLLVLTPDFPPERGGIQALLDGLLTHLVGLRVRVLALDSPGAAPFDAARPLDVRRVSARASLGSARNIPLNAAALWEAARFRPELILSAHIVTAPAGALIGRTLGVPHVVYFYANEIVGKPRLAAFAARHSDASIAISSYTAALLDAIGVSEGVSVIPPGIELPAELPSRPPERLQRPTILTVARLKDRYKGHDVLLRAMGIIRERVPDVRWVIIGEGPLRPELEAEARERGVLEWISFLGAVSDEERDGWLERTDVFAMPSRLPGGGLAGEGFGIAFLEASSHGKPVVAGNVGGALDAVIDGQTGLLVDPADPVAVAQALTTLLGDPELARRLGEGGLAHARSLAWPLVAERVRSLLMELLERRP
jgi:phosphatidylinositol alpha-1,6-mannosyltransferase